MMKRRQWIGLTVVVLAVSMHTAKAATSTKPFQFKDQDRVALVGNAFIERENRYGYLELALTLAAIDKQVTFRNLGWSGDNVWGEARAYFGPVSDGYKHLLKYVELVKPTVIVINYGLNESFAGEAGLSRFVQQYQKLLSDLEKHDARIVMLSPTPLEKLSPPLPDPEAANEDLAIYTKAIAEIARKRGHTFVNLYDAVAPVLAQPERDLTDNTVHFTKDGYATVGRILAKELTGKDVQFSEAHEPLRRTILRKSELFFHRYRPQNETYLRGFRKHEQGNNAVEIEQFEPLVEAKDQEIARLREALAEQQGVSQ